LGRLISYASLVYAGNTTDPVRAKFYGDMQERITAASLHLLFFTLELNRIDDAALDAAMHSALGHYKPWIEDVRKDKPYQLEDRVEQLFHEKSVSGYSAWNRLFDKPSRACASRSAASRSRSSRRSICCRTCDGKKRKRRQALAKTFKANLRTFALITNTLAKDKEISDRWRGFKDVADSRHLANRVEREVVDALVAAVRAAYPRLSHRYYALKAAGLARRITAHWDRNAPLPFAATAQSLDRRAQHMVLTAYGGVLAENGGSPSVFSNDRWIDAPVRPGKAPGAFAHPTTPSAHPYVLMNYQGKPRDVMTLAHELGHGVHQVLAAPERRADGADAADAGGNRQRVRRDADLRKLARRHHRSKQRKAMLAAKVEDMINTVVRQIAFYSFERARSIPSGATAN
jgi:oligoendopeptidase F